MFAGEVAAGVVAEVVAFAGSTGMDGDGRHAVGGVEGGVKRGVLQAGAVVVERGFGGALAGAVVLVVAEIDQRNREQPAS